MYRPQVTGGTMAGGKTSAPGQMLGSSTEGGVTHRLTKGDVIVVPAGLPHWFKEVPAPISYFVVKVLNPGTVHPNRGLLPSVFMRTALLTLLFPRLLPA